MRNRAILDHSDGMFALKFYKVGSSQFTSTRMSPFTFQNASSRTCDEHLSEPRIFSNPPDPTNTVHGSI